MFETGIIGVLIVLSVLELCVTISSAVLAIKALKSGKKKENKVEFAKSRLYPPVKTAVYPEKVDL